MTDGSLTIGDAIDIFLAPTQCLSLARRLREKLKDSVAKAGNARDTRTRALHSSRVHAFLTASRLRRSGVDYSIPAMRLFAEAFPKEAAEAHFPDAAWYLRSLLIDAAARLGVPNVANPGTSIATPIPTFAQLLQALEATKSIKGSAEKSIGHPLLRQTIEQHGWKQADVQKVLQQRGYTEVQAAVAIRDGMRRRRGSAKNGHSGTGDAGSGLA